VARDAGARSGLIHSTNRPGYQELPNADGLPQMVCYLRRCGGSQTLPLSGSGRRTTIHPYAAVMTTLAAARIRSQ